MKTTLNGCGAGCETDINTCANECSLSELGRTSQMRAVMSAFGSKADIALAVASVRSAAAGSQPYITNEAVSVSELICDSWAFTCFAVNKWPSRFFNGP